jgi:hypothetical protein
MPVLLVGSLLAGIVSLVLQLRTYRSKNSASAVDTESVFRNSPSLFRSSEFILTLIATLSTMAVILLTRLINVPVNETLMTWQASSPPENVMQLWAPWEGSHTIRTVIALLGFACLAYATTTPPRQPPDQQRAPRQ